MGEPVREGALLCPRAEWGGGVEETGASRVWGVARGGRGAVRRGGGGFRAHHTRAPRGVRGAPRPVAAVRRRGAARGVVHEEGGAAPRGAAARRRLLPLLRGLGGRSHVVDRRRPADRRLGGLLEPRFRLPGAGIGGESGRLPGPWFLAVFFAGGGSGFQPVGRSERCSEILLASALSAFVR